MSEEKVEQKQKVTVEKTSEPLLALIRIRGPVKLPAAIEDTLKMLKLHKKNTLVLIKPTPSLMGMIEKVKYYITYGTIDSETLKELKEKKGEGNIYHMNNPVKGFGRKGVKAVFSVGGALGDRKEMINDLIRRML